MLCIFILHITSYYLDTVGLMTSNARPGTANIIKRRKSIKIEDKEIVRNSFNLTSDFATTG